VPPSAGKKNISQTKFSMVKEPEKTFHTMKKLCWYPGHRNLFSAP